MLATCSRAYSNIALLRNAQARELEDVEEEDMHGKAKPKPVEVREVVVSSTVGETHTNGVARSDADGAARQESYV